MTITQPPRHYDTRHDEARSLTLLDGVTYRVRTTQGRELACRWDAGQQTFRRVSAMRQNGARNVVLPNPMVAAVCPVDLIRGHWLPYAACVRSRERRVVGPKTPTPHEKRGRAMRGDVAPAVYALVTAGAGVSADDVWPQCAPASRSTVIRVLRAAVKAGHMRGVRQSRNGVSVVLYTMATTGIERRVSSTHHADVSEGGWTPAVWVHPIRARALGLPVATRAASHDEAPTFSDPFRGAQS